MRVLVTGGRTFQDTAWLHAALDLIHSKSPITEIIEGGCTGADVRAGEWACRRELKCTIVPAEWERYSAGLKHGQKNPAGAIRNTEMAKLKPDVVLACPGGPGTAHMVSVAQAHGLRVIYLEKMPVTPAKRGPVAEPPPPVQIDVVAQPAG
jgi:hypothetical protein